MKRTSLITLVAFVMLAMLALNAAAGPSQTIFSYQGQLTDASGVPIASGNLPMTFRLYTTDTGGTACWSEAHTGGNAVAVSDGLFNVLLGQLTAIPSTCLTGDAYLELVVNGETLSPRELLTSVAFAVEASTLPAGATTLGDVNVSGSLFASKGVSVGTASPNAPLQIEKDDGVTAGEHYLSIIRRAKSGGGVVLSYQADGTAATVGRVRGSAGSDLRVGTVNYMDTITIPNANGNVGIRTTSPSYPLDVNGAVRADGYWGIDSLMLDNYTTVRPASNVYLYSPANDRDSWIYLDSADASSNWGIYHRQIDSQVGDLPPNSIGFIGGGSKVGAYIGLANGDAYFRGNVKMDSSLLVGTGAGTVSSGLYLGGDTNEHLALYEDGDQAHLFVAPFGGPNRVYDQVVVGSGPDNRTDLGVWGTVDARGFNMSGTDFTFGDVAGRGNGGRAFVHDNDDTLTINYEGDFSGGIKLNGRVSCGGLVESNLQTAAEQAAGKIERFSEGDVLCWGIDQLELCSTASDRLVQAVADGQGKPIVLGAEKIKVLGPVRRGDPLVASTTLGYAMVDDDPSAGSVIAQALENFDGQQGVIKAMIRKW